MTEMTSPGQGTLPQLLVAQARRREGRVALREKKYGIWQEVSWAQYAAQVQAVCLGLVRLGLAPGDTVAVISGNRPAWLYVELAAHSAGAITVGIPVDSGPDQVTRILDHSEARFVLVEDQEQADKVLSGRGALPRLERVIVDDMRGLEAYHEPMLADLAGMAESGRELGAREPRLYDLRLERGKPADVALLAYPPGATGASKAAMITHRNLLVMAAGVTEVDPVRETDEIFSLLPFTWVGEQLISVAIALYAGATVNFPEGPETAREDLREIGPHLVIAPPRFWESLRSECEVKMGDAGVVKRMATRAALAMGRDVAAGRAGRARYGVAYLLALRNVLDKLGLSRIRHAYADGEPLGDEALQFFRALGLNLKPVYGRTETSGICVLPRDGEVRAGTLGTPTPGTRLRISDTGEVMIASESVFAGYYKDPGATASALDDGWLHTGDRGAVDERGHLVVSAWESDGSRSAVARTTDG
jgi:long-chain acyl-CoA synthetase